MIKLEFQVKNSRVSSLLLSRALAWLLNIDVSNVVWLASDRTNWIDSESKAQISFLLERKDKEGLRSLFIKLPKEYVGDIETDGSVLHSVVIAGQLKYTMPQKSEIKVLDAGSYFGATDKAIHAVSCGEDADVIVYVRTNGEISVK